MQVPTLIEANAIGAMVDTKKGTKENQKKCSKEHLRNDLFTGGKIIATIAAGGIGIAALSPKDRAIRFSNPINNLADKIGQLAKKVNLKSVEKEMKVIIKGDPTIKVKTVIGLACAGIISLLFTARAFKQGQIDQKYTDIANFSQQQQPQQINSYRTNA